MKALCLAYHFPPVGGAAVQRNARLIGHLPEFGYETVVVTGSGRRESHWTPHDETLGQEIPSGGEVVRIAGEESVVESGRWRGRAERWLGRETPWSHWWTEAVLNVLPDLPADVDIVYAPLVPFDSFRAAHRLSQVLGKPLVIDLNDPWALDEMMVYPTWLHRWSDKRTMHRALSVAHGIVMNTPEATNRVVTSFPDLESTVVWTIPNGYASEDFHALSTRREDDVFRIVHTGYLHTEQGLEHRRTRHFRRMLGGMLADVDILPRSHVFLLEAVEDLLERAPDLAPIEVHLAGVLTSADEEVASRSGVVRLHGYVAHSVAVELLQSADLLFLPMHEVTTGRRVGIIPGKTYEYLAARRPILAAIPEGDAHDLLAAAGNASICRPSDVRAIAEAIAAQIQRKRRGEPAARPKAELVNQLEWRCRSRDLARMFDTILWRASSDATQPGSPVALVPHGE